MRIEKASKSQHIVTRALVTGGVVGALLLGVAVPAYAAVWYEAATAQRTALSISAGTGCSGIGETTVSVTKVWHTAGNSCDQRRVRWYGYQPGLGQNGFSSYAYGGPSGTTTSQSHAGYAVTGYGALKN